MMSARIFALFGLLSGGLSLLACSNAEDPAATSSHGGSGGTPGLAGHAGDSQESSFTAMGGAAGEGGSTGIAGATGTSAFCQSYCAAIHAAACTDSGSQCEQTCPEIDPSCAAWQQFQSCAAAGMTFTCDLDGHPTPATCADSYKASGDCGVSHDTKQAGQGSGGAAGSG
jgi:hypothetical protein